MTAVRKKKSQTLMRAINSTIRRFPCGITDIVYGKELSTFLNVQFDTFLGLCKRLGRSFYTLKSLDGIITRKTAERATSSKPKEMIPV